MLTHTWTSGVPKQNLANHWAGFIESRDYTHFVTLTTLYDLSIKSARRLAIRFAEQLNYNNANAEVFWVAEPFDTKEGQHIHALVKLMGISAAKGNGRILTAAKNAAGRNNTIDYENTKVLPYIKGKGAHFYIGKYIHKPNADYDFFLAK